MPKSGFYVYELVDPRTGAVFYVGKGTNRRLDAHEREARVGRVSRKCQRIRDIEAEGYSIGKRVVEWFADEQQAYNFESELVDRHGLDNLTNAIPGGGSTRAVAAQRGADREQVDATALLIRLTRNCTIEQVAIMNQMLDLRPIMGLYKGRVYEIIERRGQAWVNEIAKRHEVEFSHG